MEAGNPFSAMRHAAMFLRISASRPSDQAIFAFGGGGAGAHTMLSPPLVQHALLGLFDTRTVLPLRAACKDARAAIAGYEWEDARTVILGSVAAWRACFPRARAASVEVRVHGQRWGPPARLRRAPLDSAELGALGGMRELNLRGHRCIDSAPLGSVERLLLSNCPDFVCSGALASLTSLRELSLQMCGRGQERDSIPAAAFAGLSGLHSLSLCDCRVEGDAVFAFLPSLRHLKLKYQKIPHFSEAIGSGFKHLGALQSLDMAGCKSIAAKDLAQLCCLQSLTATCCWDSEITDAALASMGRLQVLRVAMCNRLTDAAFTPFAHTLLELDVSFCTSLTDAALAGMRSLQSLDMSGCPLLSDAALAEMSRLQSLDARDCPLFTGTALAGMGRLRVLHLGNCHSLGDATFAPLAGALRELNIVSCPQLSDAAMAHLAGLRKLTLSGCPGITDAGILHLTALLELRGDFGPGIGDASIVHLQQRCGLALLRLSGGSLTQAALDALQHIPDATFSSSTLDGAPVGAITSALRTHTSASTMRPGSAAICAWALAALGRAHEARCTAARPRRTAALPEHIEAVLLGLTGAPSTRKAAADLIFLWCWRCAPTAQAIVAAGAVPLLVAAGAPAEPALIRLGFGLRGQNLPPTLDGSADAVLLVVWSSGEAVCTVRNVSDQGTVEGLMAACEAAEGTPAYAQRLVIEGGRQLEVGRSLMHYRLRVGSYVMLLMRTI
jgi:hypothetical protein